MNDSIGPYKIERELGRGGMGEVYLARDTRLVRQVAIKALPAHLAQDPDRLARFQREAKVLASLNHPGIGAIYGLEEANGHQYLILEFVEGETLADRLSRGAVPVEESLSLAKQIAEALEVAHEKGIIHRDFKPQNVIVRPDGVVKVLDFGLARHADASVGHAPSGTGTASFPDALTRLGNMIGTPGYMSPEQARGNPVDKRADIFSFGCVLYEMLTGIMPFRGVTVADAIGATLHKNTDFALLPAGTPRRVRDLLTNCLAKDRRNRLHDIGDARLAIEQAITEPGDVIGGTTALRPWWRSAGVLATISLLALAATLMYVWSSPRPTQSPVVRLTMTIPESQALVGIPGTMMDISPDGTHVVFVGRTETGRQLYLRNLGQPDAAPIPNTDDACCPFFSPDGQWIAFAQNSKLRKVSVLGSPITTLGDATDLRGGTWGADGTIVFSPDAQSGLWCVPAAGGEPVMLTDSGTGEATSTHRWPHFLPDGKTVLFTSSDQNSNYTEATINSVSLDTGKQKVILKGGTYPRYVASGHLVYGRSGTLMAVPFDVGRLENTGVAVPVLDGVLGGPGYGSVQFACSQSGVLLYVPGASSDDYNMLTWVDHEGKETQVSSHQRSYFDSRLSPDGTRVAAQFTVSGNTDIWVLELGRDSLVRLTFDESVEMFPRWSPDGKSIVFSSDRGDSGVNLYRQPADGTGEAQRLTTSPNPQMAYGFSPDGSILLFAGRGPKTDNDILYLRVIEPESKPEVFLATPFDETYAEFSPDGKWVAYGSNESGEYEVYVRPFLRPGAETKVSDGWGNVPRWSPDGKELYYRRHQDVMVVSLTPQDDGLRAGTPRTLFTLRNSTYAGPRGISPDGTRLLFIRSASEVDGLAAQPTVVVNWLAELQAKMRAGN